MIDTLALAVSAFSLIGVAVLLYRDAKRADAGNLPVVRQSIGIARKIESLVKRHEYSKTPGHRTSLATVKDIIEAAERESAKPRFR